MKVFKQIPDHISFDEKNLEIDWKDNHKSTWNLLTLRKECPCAVCRGGDFGKIGTMTKNITQAKPVSYQVVGRYAISIKWEDSHDTGIYTYDNLRKTCECETCKGSKEMST